MKNPFKKLSRETKVGLMIGACSLAFFGTIAAIGISVSMDRNVNIADSGSLPIVLPSTTPSGDSSIVDPSNTDEVSKKEEIVKVPTNEEVDIIRYFFDIRYDVDDPKLAKATYKVGNTIHQSVGYDYALKDDSSFDVIASYPGTVKSITPDDRIYGTIVVITNGEIDFVYAGLKNVQVKVNQEVGSLEKIGESGSCTINPKNTNSLHFEIRRSGVPLNPEDCLGKVLAEL